MLKKRDFINENSIYILLFICLILIFVGNNYNPDYYYYKFIFQNLDNKYLIVEKGYIYFLLLCKKIINSYEFNILLTSFIGLSLIMMTFKKYTNMKLPIFLYLLFPFFLDIVQIRFFLAMSLFVFSLKYIIERKQIKYILLIVLAISFHKTAIIYFPIYYLYNFKIKKLKIICYLFSLIFFIFIKFDVLKMLIHVMDPLRANFYLKNNMRLGPYLFASIVIITMYLSFVSIDILKENKKLVKLLRFFLVINVYSIIIIPFFFLNGNFFRMQRPIILLNYILFSLTYKKLKKEKKFFYLSVILGFVGYLAFSRIGLKLILEILENNFIITF